MRLCAAFLAACVTTAFPSPAAGEVGPNATFAPPAPVATFLRGTIGFAVAHNWDGAGLAMPIGALAAVRAGSLAAGVAATFTAGHYVDTEVVAMAGLSTVQGRRKDGRAMLLLLAGVHHAALLDRASGQSPGAVWVPIGGIRLIAEGVVPSREFAGGFYLQVERDLASKRTVAGETWRATIVSIGGSFGLRD